MTDPTRQTPLYDQHLAEGAKMVPFAGWQMPLHYGSQLNEHHVVRRDRGMFDVSHMTVIDVHGQDARAFLRWVLANDVDRLVAAGKAQYGTLLNEAGGIVDDLITYRRESGYRVVTNAGTRDAVLPWLAACQARFDGAVTVAEQAELALIAVQGPNALATLSEVLQLDLASNLSPFEFAEQGAQMIARTGYTGEDGAEFILPGAQARDLWAQLAAAGVLPIGLGARDTLRLEAGLNLYGQDMTVDTTPLVSNLAWTVPLKDESRDFIGRDALLAQKAAGVPSKLVGLVLEGRGVLRHGYPVLTSAGEGVITSGIFSPTLGYSIALARVPRAATGDAEVVIRSKHHPVSLTRPPFVKGGERAWS